VYVTTVEAVPAGLHRLEVWIPLPVSTASQEIRDVRVESPYPGTTRRERDGNALTPVAIRLECRDRAPSTPTTNAS
jgi:hypothetical protein